MEKNDKSLTIFGWIIFLPKKVCEQAKIRCWVEQNSLQLHELPLHNDKTCGAPYHERKWLDRSFFLKIMMEMWFLQYINKLY